MVLLGKSKEEAIKALEKRIKKYEGMFYVAERNTRWTACSQFSAVRKELVWALSVLKEVREWV